MMVVYYAQTGASGYARATKTFILHTSICGENVLHAHPIARDDDDDDDAEDGDQLGTFMKVRARKKRDRKR